MPVSRICSESSIENIASTGIAKLLVADCEALAKVELCCHFGSVIGPEAERIGAGVAV